MKNLLKKLHMVPDQPPQTPSSGSGIPGWFSSVAGKTPTPTAFVGDVEKKGRSAFEEEEYQLRLAIELSEKEDPEAVQIEAVKKISLGSSSARTSPAELLAFSYWNYNVLSFDDKIPDGFYDLYGVSAHPSAEMPSLVDLQEAAASNSICCEAVLVNRSGDPDLLKLEQEALRMALQSKCGSADYAERSLVQKLANLVSDYMGGAIGKSSNILEAWKSFRMTIGDTVLPLGYVTVGLARHRALMFKVLADSVGLPCQLVKGKVFTGSDDGATNIVRLGDGREWTVDLMTNPGTLVLYKKCDNSSSAFNPSIGDCENSQVISCSSSTSSIFSCSSGKETTDNRSFGYVGTSGSEASTLGELSNEEIYRAKTFSKEPQKKPRDGTGEVTNHAKNLPSQKAPLHDTSAKKNSSTSLARSPSWTEGVSSPVVNKMKVKDVSQYMIDATKENPQLAQKLHNVLLESGVVLPPDFFTEISSEQQQTSISKGIRSSDFTNKTRKRETEVNQISKGQLPKDHCSPGQPLPYPHSKDIHGKKAQSKPQNCPKPSRALEVYNPSQSEDCSARKQPTQLKMTDNMPVAAAVATAAIVASSMVVAASKSNSDTIVDIPVTTAATAAVVATTTVNMQKEQLLSYDPLRAIPNCKNAEVAKQKVEKAPQSDEKKTSGHASDDIFKGDAENAVHQKAERSSAKTIGSNSVTSDTSLEDVAEFEIRWEEIVLGERVGLGSCGEVYRGDWNGTEVAVKKFLEQDLSGDALEEFRSEVRIMKRLRHPNVVLFMGAVTRVPHLSIITEFLHRGSLFRLIHRPNNQLDERRRMKMALDIARGMNYLHNCSPAIVHRDLKSPNLLVDRNWVVKVSDFGLSRIKHNTFLSSRSTSGTAEWMAPEVLRNEPSDEKCDIYSFGVILWELCTLRQPWGEMNPMQVVGAVGFQQRHLDIPDDMDPVIANIILRCWQLDPKSRPSFSEIMSELKPLQKPATNSPMARQRNASSSQNC